MNLNIIAVDDDIISLEILAECVSMSFHNCTINTYFNPFKALSDIKEKSLVPDVMFLDVEMPGMTGIELARQLKEINASIKIIFVTSSTEYALDAFEIHAHGYIVKPISVQSVLDELNSLVEQIDCLNMNRASKAIWAVTFGEFNIYINGEEIKFARPKEKEMLAYLVFQHGAGCTARELSAVLFEDREYTHSLKNQMQSLKSQLCKTLDEYSVSELVISQHNYISINLDMVDSDYYHFLASENKALSDYKGIFMQGYMWADFTNNRLKEKKSGFNQI